MQSACTLPARFLPACCLPNDLLTASLCAPPPPPPPPRPAPPHPTTTHTHTTTHPPAHLHARLVDHLLQRRL